MLHAQTSPNINEVGLARAFLEALVVERAAASSGSTSKKAIDALLGDEEAKPEKVTQLAIKPSVAACAVVMAAGISSLPGLLSQLRGASPVVLFDAGPWSEAAIESVLDAAFFTDKTAYPPAPDSRMPLMIVRDGKAKQHTPDQGNEGVTEAISNGWPVIAVSRDPKRFLPSIIHEAADAVVRLPGLTNARLGLVLEAITGAGPSAPLEDGFAASVRISDLDISIRPGLTADECVQRLRAKHLRAGAADAGPTLYDLPAYRTAKDWGLELVADLVAYRSGQIAWADIDHKAVLLSGPPGVGKTEFARALARTAGIPLIETSTAAWNSATYLSGSLQMIASVFAEARSRAPAILLLDELDGLSNRDTIAGEYREYWVQVVNAVLTELTSPANAGVVVIGASNFPERIDPAVRRAGRLDHHIALDLPDNRELAEIIRFYLGDDLGNSDLRAVATMASGGSGADAFAWVNRARAAARRQNRALELPDLIAAVQGNRSPLSGELRRHICAHEAGHVLASILLGAGEVEAVAIHAGGGAAHFEIDINELMTLSGLERRISVLLAGRAAEIAIMGEASIGASLGAASDLERATALAVEIETMRGMGAWGLVYCPQTPADLSRNPALLGAVKARLAAADTRVLELLVEHRAKLETLTDELQRTGYLSGPEAKALVNAESMRMAS